MTAFMSKRVRSSIIVLAACAALGLAGCETTGKIGQTSALLSLPRSSVVMHTGARSTLDMDSHGGPWEPVILQSMRVALGNWLDM